jgi:hypothetical protein
MKDEFESTCNDCREKTRPFVEAIHSFMVCPGWVTVARKGLSTTGMQLGEIPRPAAYQRDIPAESTSSHESCHESASLSETSAKASTVQVQR